jgi:hypothetical protein
MWCAGVVSVWYQGRAAAETSCQAQGDVIACNARKSPPSDESADFCPDLCPPGPRLPTWDDLSWSRKPDSEPRGCAAQTSKTGGCRFESCRPCGRKQAKTAAGAAVLSLFPTRLW